LRELKNFKACYAGKVWVSESVPVWARQLSGHLVYHVIHEQRYINVNTPAYKLAE